MIERHSHIEALSRLISFQPVVGIIGARQVGKTTLARQFISKWDKQSTYFDLENAKDYAKLQDPMLALESLKGLVVIDEVQRIPDLFMTLRVLVDRPRTPARFLVLGSASPGLLRQGSESLAGRISYYELAGLSLEEVGKKQYDRLWLRGGFPRSFLASSNTWSHRWRRSFISTFIERDLPQLGINIDSVTLRRFWTMLANYHGQIWNASEFARSFGVSGRTVRRYLDILTSAMIIKQVQPWRENISKRQVKAQKVYVKDSGLLHALLGLKDKLDLEGHPKVGASWEGFVIQEIVNILGVYDEECFFWATHAGAELDLLVVRGKRKYGFEVKRTSAPRITPSMRSALAELKLTRLDVIHAGTDTYPMAKNIRAVALQRLLEDIKALP